MSSCRPRRARRRGRAPASLSVSDVPFWLLAVAAADAVGSAPSVASCLAFLGDTLEGLALAFNSIEELTTLSWERLNDLVLAPGSRNPGLAGEKSTSCRTLNLCCDIFIDSAFAPLARCGRAKRPGRTRPYKAGSDRHCAPVTLPLHVAITAPTASRLRTIGPDG